MRNRAKIPFFLALRSIKRGNKWTFLLIICLITVAFINLVFISSLFSGIIEMSNNQIIDTYTGHISLTPKDGGNYLTGKNDLIKKIDKTENVVAASPQLVVPASAEYKNIKANVPIFAINPTEENRVTNIYSKMSEGKYLEPDDKYQIIIGSEIAGKEQANASTISFKGANVGDKVNLVVNGKEYEFTIKGIFYTKFMFTDRVAFINQKTWEEINPSAGGDVANTINIRINDKKNIDSVKSSLEGQQIKANFNKWEESLSFMKSINKTFDALRLVLILIGAVIAAITIFIVIYVDVSDRRQEIGILRAIGIGPSLIIMSYVLRALVYSIAGIVAGMLLFIFGFVPYFSAHPLPLPLGDASLVVDYKEIFLRIIVILTVAIISGFVPSYSVTKIKILDSIKK